MIGIPRCFPRLDILFWVFAIVNAGVGTCSEGVWFNRSSPAVLDRAVIVSGDRFVRPRIEQLSRQFLDGAATGKKLARLTMGMSDGAISRALFHGTFENTYESTMHEIQAYSLPDTPIARLIVLDGKALLTYRNKDSYEELLMTTNNDPTHIHEAGVDFQILHFVLTEPGPALRPSDYALKCYLKASPVVSLAASVAVTRMLRDFTRIPQLIAIIRSDAWFAEPFDFPALFPFQKSLVLPTKAQYVLSPFISCSATENHGIRCSGHNFEP
jgi:hypothetical protein